MKNGKYRIEVVEIACEVIRALSGNEFQPIDLKVITEQVGAAKDRVFRILKSLESAGFAEDTGEGWKLAPALVQIAENFRLGITKFFREKDEEIEEYLKKWR